MKLRTSLFTLATACALSLAALGASAQSAPSLYQQQFGGKEGMAKIVHEMMVGVLADPRLEDFFGDADIERLEKLLAEQFCELTDGPCKYSGKSMKESHEKFAIRTRHFNFLAEHLQVAMDRNGVPNWAQNKLVAKLAPMHRDVVKP